MQGGAARLPADPHETYSQSCAGSGSIGPYGQPTIPRDESSRLAPEAECKSKLIFATKIMTWLINAQMGPCSAFE